MRLQFIDDIKLEEEAFNDHQGRATAKQLIGEFDLLKEAKIADVIGLEYWQNDGSTLVVAIPSTATVFWGLRVAKLAEQLGANEYDFERVMHEGIIYYAVRLWWD